MVRLGDVCDILNGYAFKSEEYSDSGFRIIRISNVQKGYVEDTTPVFYPEDNPIVNKYELFENDLLLSLTGNVGRVALLEKEFLPAALNQRVACLRPKKGTAVRTKYLFHILNSDAFEKACILSSKGLAQKNMSTEWLKDYLIPLPSLEKQDEISETLNKVDELISLRKKQLQKLDDLIKSCFVEMFEQGSYEQVEFGDICVFLRNGANIKQTKGAAGIPITRIETLANDVFNIDRLGYADIFELGKYSGYRLKAGDILISHINSVAYLGRAVQYRGQLEDEPVIHGMNLLCARIKDSFNPTFVEYFFKTPSAKEYISTITKKAVNQASITTTDLKKMSIPAAPYTEQEHFAAFVAQVDKSKSTIQHGLDKLEQMKQALMQKYFG